MNAGAIAPQGFGVRQPSGALAGELMRAKAAEGHRTPGRCGALRGGERLSSAGFLLAVRPTLRPSRLCGFLMLVLVSLAITAKAESTATNPPVRFHAVDIFVDSKEQHLAAYQLEFAVTNGNAKIVGIEGGEHPAFAHPPFYDPKAMQHERVILAAFSTEAANKLPKGKTRLATIHIQFSGESRPVFEIELQAAADANGRNLEGKATSQERKPE